MPKAGDYIVYLNDKDVYHCSEEVFRGRNIVGEDGLPVTKALVETEGKDLLTNEEAVKILDDVAVGEPEEEPLLKTAVVVNSEQPKKVGKKKSKAKRKKVQQKKTKVAPVSNEKDIAPTEGDEA